MPLDQNAFPPNALAIGLRAALVSQRLTAASMPLAGITLTYNFWSVLTECHWCLPRPQLRPDGQTHWK
jgi:hypothetical protein